MLKLLNNEPLNYLRMLKWYLDLVNGLYICILFLNFIKIKIHFNFFIIARYRLEQFTLSRNEWCISRQRSWGVPIPVFYEAETDVPLLTDSSVEHIIEIFKKHGSDGW